MRKRLRHQHHRLVAGGVAVRMVFTQNISHGAGRFLMLGTRRQPKFGHRVDNTTLYWFQAITDMRQRTIEDDVHRVIEVGLFSKDV
jgi:hypothetical protein